MMAKNTFKLYRNTFTGNVVSGEAGSGGALAVPGGGDGNIDSCLLAGNYAPAFGGGTYLGGSVRLAVTNTTWTNNTCGRRGCSIYSSSGAGITFSNSSTIDLMACNDEGDCKSGFAAQMSGEMGWDETSNMSCEAGFQLINRSLLQYLQTVDGWQLSPPVRYQHLGIAKNVTNCPCFFSTPNDVPYGFGEGTITPQMKLSEISYSCSACPSGKFRSVFQGKSCTECKVPGIDCRFGAELQEGWWLNFTDGDLSSPDTKTLTYECYKEGVCLGSGCVGAEDMLQCRTGPEEYWKALEANGTERGRPRLPEIRDQCKLGYEGPVCGICSPSAPSFDGETLVHDTQYTRQGGSCTACSGFNAQNVWGVTLLVLCVLYAAVFFYRRRHTMWAQPVVLKILLAYLEMLTLLHETFDTQWPEEFGQFIGKLQAFFASIADLSALACVGHVNQWWVLVIWTFGALALAIFILWRYRAKAKRRDKKGCAEARQLCIERLFYLAFICYRLITPIVVGTFICRHIDGEQYLVADFTLQCNNPMWYLAATWSGLWILLYALGFPALLLLALYRRWPEVDFIADTYMDVHWRRCWEVVVLVNPLLLTAFIQAFPQGTRERITMAVLLSTTFLLLHVRYQPFAHNSHNRMETVALAALSLTYFIGLLIKTSDADQSQYHLLYVAVSSLAVQALCTASDTPSLPAVRALLQRCHPLHSYRHGGIGRRRGVLDGQQGGQAPGQPRSHRREAWHRQRNWPFQRRHTHRRQERVQQLR